MVKILTAICVSCRLVSDQSATKRAANRPDVVTIIRLGLRTTRPHFSKRALHLGAFTNYQYSAERQKCHQNSAPVLVIISGNSLAFGENLYQDWFLPVLHPDMSAPVMVINQSPSVWWHVNQLALESVKTPRERGGLLGRSGYFRGGAENFWGSVGNFWETSGERLDLWKRKAATGPERRDH